jgi:hypothetical protein
VIGQSPRQLDRNLALVGRVVKGIALLATLPRGSGELGFYLHSEGWCRSHIDLCNALTSAHARGPLVLGSWGRDLTWMLERLRVRRFLQHNLGYETVGSIAEGVSLDYDAQARVSGELE